MSVIRKKFGNPDFSGEPIPPFLKYAIAPQGQEVHKKAALKERTA